MTTIGADTIRRSVDVPLPPEQAFADPWCAGTDVEVRFTGIETARTSSSSTALGATPRPSS
jgi:hypothetical protein